MLKNYLKVAWRNFTANKVYSFINVAGLSAGMAVAILISLWIYDELSFNTQFKNYDRIARVMQNQTFNEVTGSQNALPYLIGAELRNNYGNDFKHVSMSSWTNNHTLAFGDNRITKSGSYVEPPMAEMLSLKMLRGSRSVLRDKHAVILSSSTATSLFGNTDPMGKLIKIDNKFDVNVSGIYEDLPYNSEFRDLTFIAPWQLYIDDNNWMEKATNPWRNNSFQAFVQLADNAVLAEVSAKIRDVKLKRVTPADAAFKPLVFLHPMRKWHLYSEFKNGENVGGKIQFVWLFGIIGFFVLLLACINFMNLSTARSEKRAREVGIRKAIGSRRLQLVKQFFAESVMVAAMAFACALLLAQLALPFFNQVADKQMTLMWSNPFFWLLALIFTLLTGLFAGSYPAIYLSSFNPVKVLKGTFRVGRFAAAPRRVLVVLQFTVSIILIIGTIIVFNQIQFAKNRPVGYSRDGLLAINLSTEEIHKHFDAISNELKNSGFVSELAESSSATTYVDEFDNGFTWEGMDPALQGDFGVVYVSKDFGKTVGWKIKEGRDFSKEFMTDSSGIILNEAAVAFAGIKQPVGKTIVWDGNSYHIIGVVKDLVMESPYQPVKRTVFVTDNYAKQVLNIRVNPSKSTHDALAVIGAVFKRYNPAQPFNYRFTDDEYARKFGYEERIGKLAGFFASLAILISCLGLFGMASFVAEQRTKEIGIRKVLGASILNLWGLLSREFVLLVIISLVLSMPVAYYLMNNWLANYHYHTDISPAVFLGAGLAAMIITLLTVSFQSVRASLANPVRSLKTE